jgi:hypothetical protein
MNNRDSNRVNELEILHPAVIFKFFIMLVMFVIVVSIGHKAGKSV